MIDKIKYSQSDINGLTRMEPDVYDGADCDQLKPRWIAGVEKEGDCSLGDVISFNAMHFPPGTRVVIEVPDCPKCGKSSEMNIPTEFDREWPDCDCGFSWTEWAKDEYS